MKNKSKILVVSYDAGGAEYVSAYVLANQDKYIFYCIIGGPAVEIFKMKGIKNLFIYQKAERELDNIFKKYTDIKFLFAGSSWGSPLEIEAIRWFKEFGKKTVVFLDHWVNYRERFGYPRLDWKNNLPDEIWVGDKYAHELAVKKFNKYCKIKLVKNNFFQEIKLNYSLREKLLKKKDCGLLFVDEPINSAVNFYGDKKKNDNSEYDVLTVILKNLLIINYTGRVILRLHPSSAPNKYDDICKIYQDRLRIEVSVGRDKFIDLVSVNLVIGISSMFLVVAHLCGKKVISFLPGRFSAYSLPFKEIKKIRNIDKLQSFLGYYLKES